MNIAVCVKQTPDTSAAVNVNAAGTGIVTDGVKLVLNPYDEYAVEEAVRLKERRKAGDEITAVTVGPAGAKDVLRNALAMGADHAVHLLDPAFDAADGQGVAALLALALKDLAPDLVLCGKQAVDDDQSQVGAALAERLGWPFVGLVVALELSDDGATAVVEREVEGAVERIQVTLPAVLSAQKGLNEPRFASLMGIMQAKKKPVRELNAAALGLDAAAAAALSHLALVKMEPPAPRPPGRKIDGDPAAACAALVKLLREESKVV